MNNNKKYLFHFHRIFNGLFIFVYSGQTICKHFISNWMYELVYDRYFLMEKLNTISVDMPTTIWACIIARIVSIILSADIGLPRDCSWTTSMIKQK